MTPRQPDIYEKMEKEIKKAKGQSKPTAAVSKTMQEATAALSNINVSVTSRVEAGIPSALIPVMPLD